MSEQVETIPTVAADFRVLREDQAAQMLGIHVQTLRRWRRAGTGPKHLRLGARLYGYRIRDVCTWQEERQQAA